MVNLVDSLQFGGNPEIYDGSGHFENRAKFARHVTLSLSVADPLMAVPPSGAPNIVGRIIYPPL